MMMSFAGYSFCKPHSASYARVSFQAAYLKAHFPAEFMAAVLSNRGGFYSAFAYVSEARRMGLTILPPDVNLSRSRWTGRGRELRVGLTAVKGLGRHAGKRLLAARKERPFASLADFLRRVGPDRDEARALIHAGAFAALEPRATPAELLWQLARASSADDGGRGAAGRLLAAPAPAAPPLPAWPERKRLRRQYAALGFLVDRHPLELFQRALEGRGLVKARDLPGLPGLAGRRVRLAGWLIAGKTVSTNRREPMQFLTFEDETGIVEAVFFPDAYRRFHAMLDRDRPYILEGLVDEDFGAVTLTVAGVERAPGP